MKRKWLVPVLGLGVALGVVFFSQPAQAVKQFKAEFDALYLKPGSTDAKQKAFAAAVEKAKCNVCHTGKKGFNTYGKQFSKLVSKRDKNDRSKIRGAFVSLAKTKVNPSDPKSTTYGQRILQGKLPVGN